jgi:hypothetical protein
MPARCVGNPGTLEEIANAALFRLSDEASLVTGVAFPSTAARRQGDGLDFRG